LNETNKMPFRINKISCIHQFFSLKRSLFGRLHVIFNFHRIRLENEKILNATFDTCPSFPVDLFKKVLLIIKRHYKVVSLSTLCENLFSSQPLAAITLDDGWRDNYEFGFPILRSLELQAAIFIVTGKVGSDEPFWQQKLGMAFQAVTNRMNHPLEFELRRLLGVDQKVPLEKDLYVKTVKKWKSLSFKDIQKNISRLSIGMNNCQSRLFLNQQEITEMSQNGIEFGAHTIDHVVLTNESDEAIIFQLQESKKYIENLLQKPVYALAYPNGAYSRNIIKKAQKLGFTIGCTTESRKINQHEKLLKLPRVDICLDNWEKFLGTNP
jgi:peptidoglycan/xylan/chitin deacetylase (PgdA/CDA1 family)